MTQTHLYIKIRDDIADQIIKHGLSKTESKLFFYFLKLDRFGDRPAKIKVAEILLATGVGKTAYHAAVAKFESLGWFDFKHSEVEVKNLCSLQNSSEKRTSGSEFRNSEPEKRTPGSELRTEIPEKRTEKPPKTAPAKDSTPPHTIQTYSDFKQTLSKEAGERFEKFCKYRMENSNLKVGSHTAWLNAHHQEYWEEFQENQERDRRNQEHLKALRTRNEQIEKEMASPEYKAAKEAARQQVQGFRKKGGAA